MFWNETALSTSTTTTGGTLPSQRITVDASYGAAPRQYEYRGAWVIVASGEYDLASIAPLREALQAASRKYPKVVLDASAVTFADSAFLNLLILTHQTGFLRIVAPSAQMRRLFEISCVDSVLETRQTIEEAVASYPACSGTAMEG
ncbi:anti-anti-sigma factor [Streptomyces sp. MnatMP-M77]|uniref:STAS domain-containing protein n=1 Tax=unclassified Streptomyces TaxID=2593676 RepID=UPI000805CAB3|nr:STAS domain-containing protein [Streptomyces sp. MnatMP-M77]SBV03795.1 anti-anti-sigma factor [Streptomyces sp. MnatMP-M77]